MTGTDLRAAVVEAHSDNGDVSLGFDDAPRAVEATSDNGDVTVTVPDDATTYDVTTSSSNGSTAAPIRTDPGSSRRITAKSSNGDVLVTYGSPADRRDPSRRGWGSPHPHDAGSHHGRCPSPSVRSTRERTRRSPREEQP